MRRFWVSTVIATLITSTVFIPAHAGLNATALIAFADVDQTAEIDAAVAAAQAAAAAAAAATAAAATNTTAAAANCIKYTESATCKKCKRVGSSHSKTFTCAAQTKTCGDSTQTDSGETFTGDQYHQTICSAHDRPFKSRNQKRWRL